MNYIIYKEFIKLGDLLKDLDYISSGGQAKYYLPENPVIVNGETEIRRGRKIYPEMTLEVEGEVIQTLAPNEAQLAAYSAEMAEKKRLQAMVNQMNQKQRPKNKTKQRKSSQPKPKFPGR